MISKLRIKICFAVRQTVHCTKSKPWIEIKEEMSLELARAVCKPLPQTSDSQEFQTWAVEEEESATIASWLRTSGCHKFSALSFPKFRACDLFVPPW